jgi:hypothetical protein
MGHHSAADNVGRSLEMAERIARSLALQTANWALNRLYPDNATCAQASRRSFAEDRFSSKNPATSKQRHKVFHYERLGKIEPLSLTTPPGP